VGLPCYTEPDPSIAPPARTPWDLTRSAGGSSGGAAAAVASGIVPVASASDGGGSIRIPASVTGLVGFKPSRGRVSNGPLGTDWSGLVHQHVLTRTVADTAAFLDAIAQDRTGGPFHAAAARAPGRLRVARSVDNVLGVTPHPACLTATDEACALLADLGHDVEDVAGPVLPAELYDQFMVLWCTGAGAMPIDPAREELLLPLTRALRMRGQELSAVALATALGLIGMAVRAARARFAAFDVIVGPTLAALPALVGQLRDDDDPWGDLDAQGRFTPYTAVHNVTGWPSISLPLHWHDEAGVTLPVGVMLTAHAGQDALLLALAAQVEAARPWRSRRPPLW
jgi:amidase